MSKYLFKICIILLLVSCNKENPITPNVPYEVSGSVTDNLGRGKSNIKIFYTSQDFVLTDEEGNWIITDLSGDYTITPSDTNYVFSPSMIQVSETQADLGFTAIHQNTTLQKTNEQKIINWLEQQQLSNGLLESSENSNFVSLYDNSIAAMVFMLYGDFERAEKIFDFFNSRIESELKSGPGGFHWFRTAAGVPYDNRWVGDNAWLLIALNNYKEMTNKSTYDELSLELANWLRSLQDTDGGLFSGYSETGDLLSYKVTEGIIDAFNAVDGYDAFHVDILDYLETNRWDNVDNALVAWENDPQYKYSIDNQTWAYLMFEDFPSSVLSLATQRLLNTQVTTATNASMTGYDIDEDRDAIFIEGTGQMALSFRYAGQYNESNNVLTELEKVFIESTLHNNSGGFTYTANINGTFIANDAYWIGADTEIALSTGVWYIFTLRHFNPFEVHKAKGIPLDDKFWLN